MGKVKGQYMTEDLTPILSFNVSGNTIPLHSYIRLGSDSASKLGSWDFYQISKPVQDAAAYAYYKKLQADAQAAAVKSKADAAALA